MALVFWGMKLVLEGVRRIIGDKIAENVGRDNYGIHVNFQSVVD